MVDPRDLSVTDSGILSLMSQSVTGYSHHFSGRPCEDASGTYCDLDGRFRIAVASDGHGDSACMRSEIGSRIAVDVSIDCLKQFAEVLASDDGSALRDDLRTRSRQAIAIRRLTDSIVFGWRDAVMDHYQQNPIDREELADAREPYGELYVKGERIDHIYGATLVAALWTADFLILLQQGDGDCLVVNSDLSVTRPVPVDDQCVGNVTTSLCNVTAHEEVRYLVTTLDGQPPIAVSLSTDGVANSFQTDEQMDLFIKDVLRDCTVQDDFKTVRDDLEDKLAELSKTGSGDDVSVALIYDAAAISSFVKEIKRDVQEVAIAEKMESVRTKLTSMERKWSHLHDAMEQARAKQEVAAARVEELMRAVRRTEDELAHEQQRFLQIKQVNDEAARQRRAQALNNYSATKPGMPPRVPAPRMLSPEERRIKDRIKKMTVRLRKEQHVLALAQEKLERFDDSDVAAFLEYDKEYQEHKDELKRLQLSLNVPEIDVISED